MTFPESLRNRKQWLVWKFEQQSGDRKPRKVPYYANGQRRHGKQGDDSDRASLTDYDTAQRIAQDGYDGLGFAFLPGDGLIGIDLDGCFNTDDTARHDRAVKIITACNSYTELSPSGNGVHIIVEGESDTFKSNEMGIEVFCGRQFFTMTGRPRAGSPDTVNQISADTLDKLRKTVKQKQQVDRAKPKPRPAVFNNNTPDIQKIESALAYIAPDCGYDEWIRVGMAIHEALGESGFGVWDYWSAKSSKYSGESDLMTHWKSFGGGTVTIATVFRMAIDAGWRPPRVIENPAPVINQPARAVNEVIDMETGEVMPAPAFSQDFADYYSPLPLTSARGKPLKHIDNLAEINRRLNITIRYNVIKKEEEILIPGKSFSVDNQANASFAWLMSECSRFEYPVDKLGDFLTYLSDQNLYNPVAEWVLSRPWDGVSRLQSLYDTITTRDSEHNWLKAALIRRWLISAVGAAFSPDGIAAGGVLTLQGEQNLGKTKWLKLLAPPELGLIKDGMILRPDDKDSVKQVCSFWLVELGELDATFRKSDMAALKAFITSKSDVLRRAYARKESHFARRTVFFASVNPTEFLHDTSGNRRYWTIPCAKINHHHNIDMQQLWAEVKCQLWDKGESHYLSHDELDALNGQNEHHMSIDPIEERIMSSLDWSENQTLWRWATATDVLLEIGIDRPTKADVNTCAIFIRKRNGGQDRRSNGRRQLLCPTVIRQY